MRFFNFTNESTYHLFQWLIHSGRVDVDALVEKTLSDIRFNELMEMDLATSALAKDHLQQQLTQLFRELRQTWSAHHELELDRYSVEACAASNDYAEPDALFLSLLDRAAASISFSAVAEALLRRAGKWAPDHE